MFFVFLVVLILEQDVGRLEVAVDDALPVGGVDGPRQRLYQMRRRAGRQR